MAARRSRSQRTKTAQVAPRALPTREAATYLGLAPHTLSQWRVTGEGPVFVKAGSAVLYLIADLNQWLRERRRISTSDDGVGLQAGT